MDDSTAALIAKALGHPVRLHIMRLLAAQTECRAAEVFAELPLAQSTISEHLRVLKDAGLVSSRPVGNTMVYCLAPAILSEFVSQLSELGSNRASCKSTN